MARVKDVLDDGWRIRPLSMLLLVCAGTLGSMIVYNSESDFWIAYKKIMIADCLHNRVCVFTLLNEDELTALIKKKYKCQIEKKIAENATQEIFLLSDGRILDKDKWNRDAFLYESLSDYGLVSKSMGNIYIAIPSLHNPENE